MHFFRTIIAIILICPASLACAAEEPFCADRTAPIYLLLDNAIFSNLIAGGVVVVGNHDGILATAARGRMDARPDAPLLDDSTIFDLASLTKVIATTPAVMKLLDMKLISLKDPISRWFPEFRKNKGDVTILHLLTHTSGLRDFDLKRGQSIGTAIRRAAAERYGPPPGSRFAYADINFIILGELVQRITGSRLDQFCHDQLYAPLGAQDTTFLPSRKMVEEIAPTLGYASGTVQDRNARRLGSVAGHAGLFSSANDLSRFARMLLGRGSLDGKRILSEQAVTQMTTPYSCSARGFIRSPGWDMKSPFSAPKGSFSECSFGHTGYSGSSIWIDPEQDLFVIVLTNRLNYKDTWKFKQLRRDISTAATEQFKQPDDSHPVDLALLTPELNVMAQPLPRPVVSVRTASRPHKYRLVAFHQERTKHYKKHKGRHHSRKARV